MLFRSEITGQQLWDLYLGSFKPEDNPIFRDPSSSLHNCNHCNNFMRRYGNIVAIDKDNKIMSLFSIENVPDEYKASVATIDKVLCKSKISGVFFETFAELNSLPYEHCTKNAEIFQLGVAKNFKMYTEEEAAKYKNTVTVGKSYEFNHLHLFVPAAFVDTTGMSIERIIAFYRDKHDVFKRAMEEISLDTLQLVADLIKQGSLLDGDSHLPMVNNAIVLKKEWQEEKDKEIWYWKVTYALPEYVAKFKNHLIGVLCSDIEEGVELNKACKDWNFRVDPVNYHKATAPITQAQIDAAQKFVEEHGYTASFNRRLATIDDIRVSEILHVNKTTGKAKTAGLFAAVSPTKGPVKQNFDGIEEIPIEKFMSDILPGCTSVEAYLENRMDRNFLNLTTSAEDSKQIFKWNNPFSYTFNGNLAGKSMLKEAVKAAGGNVDGILRFSISWNTDGRFNVDLDAHAIEPNNTHIYYGDYKGCKTSMSGMLDVDMICPRGQGIENITWSDLDKMKPGAYKFYIVNFDGGHTGDTTAEIAIGSDVYNYNVGVVTSPVVIAIVTMNSDKTFSIEHKIQPSEQVAKEIWGLTTNQFHKVNLVCLSPNHWGDNNVGNKFYLFMLDGCKNPDAVRGFHNEHLIPELLEHRKVLEALGAKCLIEPTENQLAGLGFNSTVRDEVILKLTGTFNRVVKVKF